MNINMFFFFIQQDVELGAFIEKDSYTKKPLQQQKSVYTIQSVQGPADKMVRHDFPSSF